MAIDKNFVVRNGIEVAENLIVASTSLDAVGLGTTTPSSKVDVAGGITADNILVRSNGITTSLGEFNVGTGGTIISAIPDTSLIGLHTASPTFAVQIDNPTGNSTSFYVKEGDVNINTGGLRVGGASTFTGDVSFGSTATFGDDDRLRFGDNNDLQIYHDGSNSVIEESGPGNLRVNTSNFVLKNAANSQIMVRASQSSGEVELYFDGSEKLATTGAGVTIFGTTETQQLNVTGVSTLGVTTATNLTLRQLNVSGVSTFNDNVKINSLTENRIPIIGVGSTIEDDTNLTFDGTQLALGVGLTVTGVSTFAGNIDANGDLDVDGFTELDDVNVSGAITATTFTGNLAGTASTATIATYTSNWILESGDGSNYGISGPGLTGTENDPTFHLTRGEKYKFTNNTGGHPFRIQSTPNGSVGTQYDDGITNNDAGDGTTLLWDVQMDAPNILYYQCTSHGGMGGKIYIGNSGSSIDVDGHTETDTLNVSGLSTFVGLSTFNDGIIIVSGVSTLGVTTATNLTLQQLNVSGVSTLGVTTLTNTTTQQLNVSGFSTFSDNVKISSLTENRIPIIGAGSTIEDDANFTFDGTQLALGVGLTVTGVSTFAGNIDANGDLDVDGHTELDDLQVSGITTFTNTTENTLGNVDTGSVQLDGGIGVDGNVTVGGALSVTGNSYFVGMVTFAAGTDGNISLGDANTDNVIFNADVNSNIIPNTTSTYDLGSSSQKWRDFYLSGNAGIGSLNVTGLSTLGVTTATDVTLQQLNVSGVSTLGITTLTDVTAQQLNVSGLSTFVGLSTFNDGIIIVSGVSTLGVTTATNLTSEQLNVTGVSTLGVTTLTNTTTQQLNVSGVSTLGVTTLTNTTTQQLNVSGLSTLGVTTATNLTLQQLNVSGVSTLGITTLTNVTAQQLNVSGVSTLGVTTATDVTLQQLNVSGLSTLGVTTLSNTTTQQLNVSGVSTLGVTTLTSTLNVSGIITAQSGVDITGGNTKIKGAVETVSVGSYSGDILTLDTELGTLFTHDLQSGSIGIVSITNFPVTSNTFHTVTLLLNQNSTGTGNTTAETGIGTNITLTPDGVSGFNTTPISSFGVNITASITPEDIDVVTFGIHYNGSGTGTPANYKVFITKNGSFRYG